MGILSCQELVDGSEQHTPQDDGGVEDAWSVEDRRGRHRESTKERNRR